MNKTKFFNSMAAVILIVALSVWFTSCRKVSEEPEPDLLCADIIGKWYNGFIPERNIHAGYVLEFRTDGTYSCITENETINGMFRITEKEKTTTTLTGKYIALDGSIVELTNIYDATLYKILASGTTAFDKLWVYHFFAGDYWTGQIKVHLYSNNIFVGCLGLGEGVGGKRQGE